MSQTEYRTFTPVQQQALYNIARLALIILEHAENGSIEDVANTGIKLAVVAQNLLTEIDTLQALTDASAPAATEPAPEAGKRFEAQYTFGNLYAVWDNVNEGFVTQGYKHFVEAENLATAMNAEHEAQAAADALNAGSQETEGA